MRDGEEGQEGIEGKVRDEGKGYREKVKTGDDVEGEREEGEQVKCKEKV